MLPSIAPKQAKPAAPEPQADMAERWRQLALYSYAAIDMALDCTRSGATSMLLEAIAELEGAIDELDALAMAREAAP